jgi:hypothetical protein
VSKNLRAVGKIDDRSSGQRVADKGSDATGVEDPIKITTGGLGSIGELVTGCLDLHAGVVGLLHTFCSFVRLFQEQGVPLSSSSGLGDKPKQDFTRIDSGVAEAPTDQLRSDGCLGFHLLGAAPMPATDGATRDCFAFARCPDCFEIAMH